MLPLKSNFEPRSRRASAEKHHSQQRTGVQAQLGSISPTDLSLHVESDSNSINQSSDSHQLSLAPDTYHFQQSDYPSGQGQHQLGIVYNSAYDTLTPSSQPPAYIRYGPPLLVTNYFSDRYADHGTVHRMATQVIQTTPPHFANQQFSFNSHYSPQISGQ